MGLAPRLGDLPVSDGALLGVAPERQADFEANRRALEPGREAARPG